MCSSWAILIVIHSTVIGSIGLAMVYTGKEFIKRGLPFAAFVVAAPLIIKQFNNIRYKYKSSGMLTKDEQLKVESLNEARKAGVSTDERTQQILESTREMANSDWKNIRGPRPWENSREIQTQQK